MNIKIVAKISIIQNVLSGIFTLLWKIEINYFALLICQNMPPRIIAYSPKMNFDLDSDYTLFEDGSILHEYDAHRYPKGYNLRKNYTADQISGEVKKRLLDAAEPEDREKVRILLGL